ncbi:MAG: ABC transporter permease [Armatimonadota bacterium]
MNTRKIHKTGMSLQNRHALIEGASPAIALILMIIVCVLTIPNFGSIEIRDGRLFGALIDILHRGTPVMLLAIGMTLVIATNGIDLSVGSVMAITGAVAAILLTTTSIPVIWIVPLSLAISIAIGMWNGSLVAFLQIQPIIATLILMVAGRGVAQLITNGQIIPFENKTFESIGTGSFLWMPNTVFIAAAVFFTALFLVNKTTIGLYIKAVGGNEVASRYSGVNTHMVKIFVYGFSGLCAGIAGLISTADIKAADPTHCGMYLELDAVLAAVVGGTMLNGGKFSLPGSIIGALFIQTLTTGMLMKGIGVEYTLVIKAIIVVIVCLVRSLVSQKPVSIAWLLGGASK